VEYYKDPVEKLWQDLDSDSEGLTRIEAQRRLVRDGRNKLETATRISPFQILINQFRNFIIYILLFAVCFSILIGEHIDSILILLILILNAVIGFLQEYSAQKSLQALKRLTTTKATVLRDGQALVIDAADLVIGDVILLKAGDRVPADARIIEAICLKTDEATLTGESLPVDKDNNIFSQDMPMADRKNMLFSATAVATGNARALVVATGMDTEIGKITTLVKEVQEEMTPLQKRLDRFGRRLGWVIIGICLIVLLMTTSRAYFTTGLDTNLLLSFALISISLAVAAVPTALPAVVTIALSIGVKRLLARKALVRRLSSVETLGSCDVICTDKTGTLTENQMTVRYAWTLDGETTFTGFGYDPEGDISSSVMNLPARIGLLCNNSSLYQKDNTWHITGDPTEAALLVSARKAGIEETGQRLDELPFDSERKCMSVLVREGDKLLVYAKGAPGQILACCNRVCVNGEEIPLNDQLRQTIMEQNDKYASAALRVLGFAYRGVKKEPLLEEKDLVFAGLQAMIDPPRPDVMESIRRTRTAGIRVIMITGDYRETARAIGRETGITGEVITGTEMEKMSDDELRDALHRDANIFARVVPEHKQRIIGILQMMGHTVAMTGDGVNDAPALKKANIGVAVGSGTEVAKEASDFVLLDDSFTHIVNAIEEGRGIYDNIQKSIMLLLSGNIGEVLIIFTAVLFGLNLPLTAILLLWINMVTDGAPALAFSVDPYGSDIMQRPPKPRNEGILPIPRATTICVLGLAGTIIALFLFAGYGGNSDDNGKLMLAQTMVFNFVVLYECILVVIIRQAYHVPFYSNAWIWAAVLLSILLQALLMYTPLYSIFKIVPLSSDQLLVLFASGVLFFCCGQVYLFIAKRALPLTACNSILM